MSCRCAGSGWRDRVWAKHAGHGPGGVRELQRRGRERRRRRRAGGVCEARLHKAVPRLPSVVNSLGERPVLSRICAILKVREPKVARASRRGERVVPRATDAVVDAPQVRNTSARPSGTCRLGHRREEALRIEASRTVLRRPLGGARLERRPADLVRVRGLVQAAYAERVRPCGDALEVLPSSAESSGCSALQPPVASHGVSAGPRLCPQHRSRLGRWRQGKVKWGGS